MSAASTCARRCCQLHPLLFILKLSVVLVVVLVVLVVLMEVRLVVVGKCEGRCC